jgi:hypothetical protein
MTRQSLGRNKFQEREDFTRRLAETLIRTGRSLSPTRLVSEFNLYYKGPKIHMHSCRKWLHGDAIPTQEKLVVLAHMLGVAPDWLRYGSDKQVVQEPHLNAYVANPEDLSLLAAIQQLTQRDKHVLQDLIRNMIKMA